MHNVLRIFLWSFSAATTTTTPETGTAPAANTHTPHPTGTDSIPGQADNPNLDPSDGTSALDSLPGATSADVHTGLGHPGQGQTSTELRHGGKHTASRDGAGLEGVGGKGDKGVESELRRLQDDRPMGEHGVKTARGADATLAGVERVENVKDQELAGSRD